MDDPYLRKMIYKSGDEEKSRGPTSIFVKCDCGSESLNIEYDKTDESFYVSIWKYSNASSRLTWWDRLRFIWNILTTGKPYEDEIILSRDKAGLVSKFLDK